MTTKEAITLALDTILEANGKDATVKVSTVKKLLASV